MSENSVFLEYLICLFMKQTQKRTQKNSFKNNKTSTN